MQLMNAPVTAAVCESKLRCLFIGSVRQEIRYMLAHIKNDRSRAIKDPFVKTYGTNKNAKPGEKKSKKQLEERKPALSTELRGRLAAIDL